MTDADHPRACGANSKLAAGANAEVGSSPRMRGKQHRLVACLPGVRIIPAHAGQTSASTCALAVSADHPRACGANRPTFPSQSPVFGSSPRMRGKLWLSPNPRARGRIIPAHAGQTPRNKPTWCSGTDHPRACGANWFADGTVEVLGGSSPRMRGKLALSLAPCRGVRIIPAHAGQTSTPMSVPCSISDHPRACGANAPLVYALLRLRGSSPRMRGKPASPRLV